MHPFRRKKVVPEQPERKEKKTVEDIDAFFVPAEFFSEVDKLRERIFKKKTVDLDHIKEMVRTNHRLNRFEKNAGFVALNDKTLPCTSIRGNKEVRMLGIIEEIRGKYIGLRTELMQDTTIKKSTYIADMLKGMNWRKY